MSEDSTGLNIYSRDENGTPGSNNMGPDAVNGDNINTKIVDELNRIFEDRLQDIDIYANGDSQIRSQTYKDWVAMLIRLIKDLLGTFQELEYEACQRVNLLEKKLETCKIYHSDDDELRKDFTTLLELVQKAYEMHRWDVEGIKFHTITLKDIFGDKIPSTCIKTAKENGGLSSEIGSTTESEKKEYIDESTPTPGNSYMAIDEVFHIGMSGMKEILRTKDEALEKALQENQSLKDEIAKLKKNAFDQEKALVNQRALAIEVADKYDQILQMRDEINLLEEEVKKAHKKIQLKDDVIRELRKESKVGFKSTGEDSTRMVTFGQDQIYPYSTMDVSTTESPNVSMKMLTQIGLEHLSMADDKETDYIKTLKEELEEFFKQQQNQQTSFENQRRLSLGQQGLLMDLVNRLGADLQKSRAKLLYVQSKLLEIIGDQNLNARADCESGYLSQEDLRNEDNTIERISECIRNLRNENFELQNKVQKLNEDIDRINTTMSCMARKVDCNEKILHKVACALSNIWGKEIPCMVNENDNSDVHPLCQAMENLQSEVCEQKTTIKCLHDTISKKDSEILSLVNQNSTTQHDCEIKNRTIAELQKTIATNENAMEKLLNTKKDLEAELKRQETLVHDMESNITKMKAEKVDLERECEYQQTTISNLRIALEDSKRHPGGLSLNSVSSSGDNSAQSNNTGSIWNWWRSNVHDV